MILSYYVFLITSNHRSVGAGRELQKSSPALLQSRPPREGQSILKYAWKFSNSCSREVQIHLNFGILKHCFHVLKILKSKAISEQPDSILSNTCRAKITQMISWGGSKPEANSTIFLCYHIGHDGTSILVQLRSLLKLWFSAKAVQDHHPTEQSFAVNSVSVLAAKKISHPWDESSTVLPAGQGNGLSSFALCSCSFTSSTVCSFGFHSRRKMENF